MLKPLFKRLYEHTKGDGWTTSYPTSVWLAPQPWWAGVCDMLVCFSQRKKWMPAFLLPAQGWGNKVALSVEPVYHLLPESIMGRVGTSILFGISQEFASIVSSVSSSASSKSDSLQLLLLLAEPSHPFSLALTLICDFPRHLSTDHFPQSCCLKLLSL